MKMEIVKCDGCGIVKGETNHWWRLNQAGSMLSVTSSNGVSQDTWLDLCGEACVIKKVSEFLGSRQCQS